MTSTAQNPSIQDTFNSEHIDNASLHLAGAKGLLMLLQTTLEPSVEQLTKAETVGILKTAQSLTVWAYDELSKDEDQNGHDWTTVMQWLDGVRGALSALKGGYLSEYDLPNNLIQIAAIHSLQAVSSEALAYINNYGDEGSV